MLRYGPDEIHNRVLELNASDERGIDVVRHKVKDFAQLSVARDAGNGEYPCPPYKIIILDEADLMTGAPLFFASRNYFVVICRFPNPHLSGCTERSEAHNGILQQGDSVLFDLQLCHSYH